MILIVSTQMTNDELFQHPDLSKRFWVMGDDAEEGDHLLGAISTDMSNRIVNHEELNKAAFDLHQTLPVSVGGDRKLPASFVEPVLSLPPMDFGPDYFSLAGYVFVSRLFRDMLAQPDDAVQYWQVQIRRASDQAREKDYQLLRILRWQPAMDWSLSVYNKEDTFNRRTGEKFVTLSAIDRFVLLSTLDSGMEVFRPAESRPMALVADRVAERVMRSGCVGVAFCDPETNSLPPRRFRTAEGIFTLER